MLEEFIFMNTINIHISNVTKVAFSNDGQYMVTGSNTNIVQIYDINSEQFIHTLPRLLSSEHQYSVTAIAISQDNQRIAFSSSNKVIRIWDRNNTDDTKPYTAIGQTSIQYSLTFTPNRQAIISSSTMNQQIIFWDINTGKKLFTLGKGHPNGIQSLALSSDGLKLVSAGGTRDINVRIWDVNANSVLEMIDLKDM